MSTAKKIGIIGTGGFAREVLCLIHDLNLGDRVFAFLEPDSIWEMKWKNKILMDVPVMPMSSVQTAQHVISIGVGDPGIRQKITTQLPPDTDYISLVHPSVVCSKWTEIGKGAIITAGCILTSQIKIGDFVQLNLQTTIGHDCQIGDFFTTAPSVNISGNCTFGDRVYLGTGAATKQGVSICADVVIGMGAMVVKDIVEPGTYVGIPAVKK